MIYYHQLKEIIKELCTEDFSKIIPYYIDRGVTMYFLDAGLVLKLKRKKLMEKRRFNLGGIMSYVYISISEDIHNLKGLPLDEIYSFSKEKITHEKNLVEKKAEEDKDEFLTFLKGYNL